MSASPPATAAVRLEDYAGVYRLPGNYASAEVSVQNGLLHIMLSGVAAEPMVFGPVAPLAFGPPGTNLPAITFQCDANGCVSALNYALFRFQKK